MRDTCWTIEGPIAGGNVFVVDQIDGTLENMNRVLVYPTIPIALIRKKKVLMKYCSKDPSYINHILWICFSNLEKIPSEMIAKT